MHHLIELIEGVDSPRVALLGDYMLDKYVYGDSERISPEAPVIVLRKTGAESRPGGAASVAASILALGGRVCCVGLIGQDAAGEELMSLLARDGAETSTLTRLAGRPTTVKQRIVGLARHRHRQQLLRMDEEAPERPPAGVNATIRASLRSAAANCQVVALADYDKGVLNDLDTPQLIADAQAAGATVIVDPAAIDDYRRYRGANIITPNRFEAELASKVKITNDKSLARCAERLLQAANAEAVVITLDSEGAYVTRKGEPGRRAATRQRAVYDVAGAGDVVLAMLSVALAGGAALDDAVALANVAGGLEVEQFGVVPITREEVADEVRRLVAIRSGKVVTRERLAKEIERLREDGGKVAFTNGCFDLLHMGHVRYLQQARQLGSCLIVAINSDDSIKRLKGPARPVIGQDERAEMIASLECVDYVTIFEEDTPEQLLELLQPETLVKGGSTGEIVGQAYVESYGGQAVKVDLVEGLSTTDIINKILETHDAGGGEANG